VVCTAVPLSVVVAAQPSIATAAHVQVLELDDQIISPVTQQYILEGIRQAEADRAECLVILLDTPGGLLDSTRAIVKGIMNAAVPVVVYVAPSGARAGSAGVFITLAAHIAAMAPSTHIGAAHPVLVGEGNPVKRLTKRLRPDAGHDSEGEPPAAPEPAGEADPMSQKILNDTVAWVTTIARARSRNEDWATRAVTESVSVSEQEAVAQRIVDLTAKDLPELLQRLDGWPLETAAGSVTLKTAQAEVRRTPMTARQRFLGIITNPSIAYLLMLLGTLGLIFEFTHPGVGFPGIAGLICLILALYAFQTLPISYAALALIGLGLVLLVAEVKVAGFGLLALGGVVALTLGSLMLFEVPESINVSLRVIAPVVGGLAAVVLFLVNLAVRAQRQPAASGVDALRGKTGTAEMDLSPTGQVFVAGELWSAVSDGPVRKGETVRVTGRDGMTLRVTRAG
jgi:membrane-bound serine protease (ClpP class)